MGIERCARICVETLSRDEGFMAKKGEQAPIIMMERLQEF